MRRSLPVVFLAVVATACGAAPLAGRWQGSVAIPERELVLVVDLAPGPDGAWRGSITVPGLGVAGAALQALDVGDARVAFALGGPFAGPSQAPATVALVGDGDALRGTLTQAGNVADVRLLRVGPAAVESPPGSTPIAAALAGRWAGTFELAGAPRRMTLVLRRRDGESATAEWTIAGRRTTALPVERVAQDGPYVRVEAPAFQATFEGRHDAERGALVGTLALGGVERPLALRREQDAP